MKIFFITTVFLLGLLNIFAQEKTIDKAEFDAVMMKSYEALRNQPHRITEESLMESNYGVPLKTKIITERAGLAMRSVYESDSPVAYLKTETIFIDGKRFTKKLDNPWTEEKMETSQRPNPDDFEIKASSMAYKSLGECLLNDKNVAAYKTESSKTIFVKKNSNSYVTNETVTYYFDQGGMLVKSITETERIFTPVSVPGSSVIQKETRAKTKSTKITQIDPGIKIEAPTIG